MQVPLLLTIMALTAAGQCLTTQGTEGPNGPTSLSEPYSGRLAAVELMDGYQKWTVPETAVYRLEAHGAASYPQTREGSGDGIAGSTKYGRGAIMRGDFTLNSGDVVWTLVGQRPVQSEFNGGGGGSFVARGNSLASASPLLVAGGGGSYRVAFGTGDDSTLHAVTGTDGVDGGFGSAGRDGSGGSGCEQGGAGAGFFTDGCQSTDTRASSRFPARSFVGGGTGGTFSIEFASVGQDGGFGGGGSGSWGGAGGGGGYSGGSPANNVDHPYSGGGGSFNAGSNQDNTPGSAGGNDGAGKICITNLATSTSSTATTTTTVFCSAGEELSGEVCVPCPTGTHSDGAQCLPMLGHFLMNMEKPHLHLQGDGFGVVRMRLNVSEPPLAFYGGVTLKYSMDIATAEKDLIPDSQCDIEWTHSTTEISTTLTYGDFSGACELDSSPHEDAIVWQGFVGLFVQAGHTLRTWHFAVALNLSRTVASVYEPVFAMEFTSPAKHEEHLGQLNSTLQLYTSESFAAVFTIGSAVYEDSQTMYAEHSVDQPGQDFELVVTSLWLSRSPDPAAPVHADLTESVQEEEGNGKVATVRFSARLTGGVCDQCYLHVESTISVRDGEGRRLTLAEFHRAQSSVPISVLAAKPSGEDLERLPTLVLGMEVTLGLAFAVAVVLGLLTRALLFKFAPTAGNVSYCAFFLLEIADVLLDVVAYVFCRGAGDLDFSNDSVGVVSATLLASVSLSAFLCAAEIALFWRRRTYFQKLFWWLMCAHLVSEDFFQCALYSIIAASQAADGVGYETAVVFGMLQSGLFIGLKIWEIVRASSRVT